MYTSFVVGGVDRFRALLTLTKTCPAMRHSCIRENRMPLGRLAPFALTLLAIAAPARTPAAPAADPGAHLAIDQATSLLVISPHPDDETLCCAGVIQRVLRAGGHASVVWITSGDGSALGMLLVEKTLFDARKMRAFGEARMSEARAATSLLGVPPRGQLFLGYPDGGVL